MCRAVNAFFHSGKMLNKINHTFITLIPKPDSPESANYCRPINICSTIYNYYLKDYYRSSQNFSGKHHSSTSRGFYPLKINSR